MDPLTDILQDLRLKNSFYCRSDLRAPWGLAFSVQNGPAFHIVLTGCGFLRIDAQIVSIQAGDLMLLPHAVAHDLISATEEPAIPLKELPAVHFGNNAALLNYGGDGERSVLICGRVQFAGQVIHPLIELLPQVMLLHIDYNLERRREDAWLNSTLTMLGAEALSLRPGSVAVMTRLTDILVLEMIRAWLEENADREGSWLAALRDPDIGKALALVHHRAEERWTVNSLAAEVHLSRSVFAERFSRLVGMAPMQYVTRWKMHLASSWIEADHLRLSEVAHRLGYSSEASFSRAFKRQLQVSPGSIRRDA